MSLGERATREAKSWEPFTQNHDPSFWMALREAYAEGFMRGFNVCAELNAPQNDKLMAAIQNVFRVWITQRGRVFESMGMGNPRAMAIGEAIEQASKLLPT